MFCMYIKSVVCILYLDYLGMPGIFILYIHERSYILIYCVIQILKSVWILYPVIGIMYRMAQNPISIPEASQSVSIRLCNWCHNSELMWCLLKNSAPWLFIY